MKKYIDQPTPPSTGDQPILPYHSDQPAPPYTGPDDELRSSEGVPEVGAAVVGGIGGGLLGAVVGAAAGPVGAVAGAVIGTALASLAGASLAADRDAEEDGGPVGTLTFDDDKEAEMRGHARPGVQTGGRAVDGTPDTRGILEKTADAVTGDTLDDKTGKRVRGHDFEISDRRSSR